MNILLIGLRGSGKTAVGRRLATLLDRPLVDLDERVLATFAERTVREVWSSRGEQAWRQAEARLLEEVLEATDQVVALGGGTPMVEAARQRIQAEQRRGGAHVVYLRCEAVELARRLSRQAGDRPSLTGADPAAEVETVRAAREPTFRSLADAEIDVTKTTTDEAAESIRRALFLKPG